jgi:hypothetical protein
MTILMMKPTIAHQGTMTAMLPLLLLMWTMVLHQHFLPAESDLLC